MIMSANKNNHNAVRANFYVKKQPEQDASLLFLRHENHVFVIDFPSQLNPKKFCLKLAPKTDPPTPLQWSQTLSEMEFEILCLPKINKEI